MAAQHKDDESWTTWGLNAIAVISIVIAVLGFFGGADFELYLACFFAALGSRSLAKIIELLTNINRNIIISTNSIAEMNSKTSY